ncbi:MerR family transcriptional regulator [Neobacillus sp. FSL H8-0543]|uniref:MerR family transcriptional regulator n=1 Tax=Neobacillus sp. FSL H8-0543 TaxID=2954672 RepID=UPI003158504B
MADQEGKYNIKAASQMLGIQPGTLRAWERRYRMIAPVRNESGHRLYTDEHIKILKWLLKKVEQGFTISQAIALLDNSQVNIDSESFPLNQGNQLTRLTDELFDALVRFDEINAEEILNTLFSVFTIEKVFLDVFSPILIKIGDYWEAEKVTSAHEHYASAFLRSHMERIVLSLPNSTHLPKAVTVCSPGEWHEIGLLMLTFFLRRRGIAVVNLGANIAEEDVEKVINILQPDFLFMSCTLQQNLLTALNLVTQLRLNYQSLHIGIGGQAINHLKPLEREKYSEQIVGQNTDEWEKWLMERLRML